MPDRLTLWWLSIQAGLSNLCHRLQILFAEDDVQKVVSVSVDGRESQMVFVDHAHADMSVSQGSQKLVIFLIHCPN